MIGVSANTKYFKIGHVNIVFTVDKAEFLEFICQWMNDFKVPYIESSERKIEVNLYHYARNDLLPYEVPKQAKLIHQNDSAKYYTYKSFWIVQFNNYGFMVANRSKLKIYGFVYSEAVMASLWDFEDFIHPLFELMRQEKLYAHHAGAVCHDGCGLLIAGKSGQGKSTLSIDLLDKGFLFMSDDMSFLINQNNRYKVIGFYEPAKVFTSNIQHINALNNWKKIFSEDNCKNPLDIRHYYPDQTKITSELKGIVFPYWSPNEKSKIEIINPGKALLELMPLTMVCFDEATSKAHFEFTGELVKSIPSIRLIMGYDRVNWHPLIMRFISDIRG